MSEKIKTGRKLYNKTNDIHYYNKISNNEICLEFTSIFGSNPEKGFVPTLKYNIILKSTNEIVGGCRASIGFTDTIFYIGNVGYSIDEQYRGQGLAGETVKLLTALFRANKINTIFITNIPENKASYRVCEKLGAKFLGTYEIPKNNVRRKEFNEKYMNVWEYEF